MPASPNIRYFQSFNTEIIWDSSEKESDKGLTLMTLYFLQCFPKWCRRRWQCVWRLWVACTSFCRVDRDGEDVEEVEEEHVSPGCGTPASIETPLQSSVSRCTSLNVIRDPLAQTPTRKSDNIIVSTSQSIQTQVVQTEGKHSVRCQIFSNSVGGRT